MTLTDFLLARIAEDEGRARAALGLLGIETEWHRVEWLRERGLTIADARHITHHDPARVLAECEAKRLIVEADARRRTHNAEAASSHLAFWGDGVVEVNGERMSTAEFDERFTEPAAPSWHVRLLALPYADHPDYDPSWRP